MFLDAPLSEYRLPRVPKAVLPNVDVLGRRFPSTRSRQPNNSRLPVEQRAHEQDHFSQPPWLFCTHQP